MTAKAALVIDDTDSWRDAMAQRLEALGFAVECASRGESALLIADNFAGRFDAVVCDLQMPGINGAETIRRLKQLPATAQAVFVLWTTAGGMQGLAESVGAKYLFKMASDEELLAALYSPLAKGLQHP